MERGTELKRWYAGRDSSREPSGSSWTSALCHQSSNFLHCACNEFVMFGILPTVDVAFTSLRLTNETIFLFPRKRKRNWFASLPLNDERTLTHIRTRKLSTLISSLVPEVEQLVGALHALTGDIERSGDCSRRIAYLELVFLWGIPKMLTVIVLSTKFRMNFVWIPWLLGSQKAHLWCFSWG